MDEAVRRFNLVQNSKGIIISFDADSICDNNYLVEIENNYNKYPLANGCSIYFEHPLSGDDFPDNIYKAIRRVYDDEIEARFGFGNFLLCCSMY